MSWQDAAEVPIAVDVRTGLLCMSTERLEAPEVMFRCVEVEVWGCCCSCRPWLAMIAAHPRHDVVRRLEMGIATTVIIVARRHAETFPC
jgi:hypothetical protein